MGSIYAEARIDRPAEDVWAEVRDVGGVANVLDIVTTSSADGDVRSCTMASGNELTEKILSVDDEHRRVGYMVTEGLPVEQHAASMQVFPEGSDACTVRWITDIKPDAMAEQLAPMLQASLDNYANRS
jgi:carbon monoxide dehydrogenase subunit G